MSLETRQPNLEGPDMQIERQEDSPRFEYERLERFASSSSKVEDIFLENPEVSFSELNELIEKMVSEQSLSDDQKEKLVARAYSYVESHQSINKMVDDYQEKGEYWQNELFKDMFGVYPKGKVKLEIEPMFLYWKTTNIDDYTYCQNKATSYLTGTAIEQRESLKGSKRLLRKIIPQAFAIPSNVLPGLKARVGVRSPRSPIFGSLDHLLQLHERRHGIDRGLESPESLKELQSLMNPSLVDNDKRVKEIIPEAVKLGLELSLTSARSEILALFEPLDNYFQKGKGSTWLINCYDYI